MIAHTFRFNQEFRAGNALHWYIHHKNGECIIVYADAKHAPNALAMEDLRGPELYLEFERETSRIFNNVIDHPVDYTAIYTSYSGGETECDITRYIDVGQYGDLPDASKCSTTREEYDTYWSWRKWKFIREYEDLCKRYNLLIVGRDKEENKNCNSVMISNSFSLERQRYLNLNRQIRHLKNQEKPK